MVMVEVPDPVIEVGLKVTVSPLPWPEADRLMTESKPSVAMVVIVTLPDEFLVTLNEVGEAETVKLDAVLVTVSETVVVFIRLPLVPVIVML